MTERILVAAGTPAMIADKLEQWHFETGANGGFMLARGFSAPGNLQEFVDFVVPELQRRGLSKKKILVRPCATISSIDGNGCICRASTSRRPG